MGITPIAGGAQLRMSHHGVSFPVGLQNPLRAKGDAKATTLTPVIENVNLTPGRLFLRFRCVFALDSSGFFFVLCFCHDGLPDLCWPLVCCPYFTTSGPKVKI
jgi:hypothetical protein